MNQREFYNTITREKDANYKDKGMLMRHSNRFENNNNLLMGNANTNENEDRNYNYQREYNEYYNQRKSNSNNSKEYNLFNLNMNKSNLTDLVLSPGDNYSKNDKTNISDNPYLKRLKELNSYSNINERIDQYNNNNTKNPLLSFNTFQTIRPSYPYLPKFTNENKKTLILDLDETLVHSSFDSYPESSDFRVVIEVNNQYFPVHVSIRPSCKEFLKKMSEHYELVVFTASISQYANAVIDYIDPNHLIAHRLFRQHCVFSNDLFIKDLKYIGRDLNETIIIDNNPVSYAFNKDNGIPILTWHNNKQDKELMKMIPFLEYLAYVPDVQEVIRQVKRGNNIDYSLIERMMNSTNRSQDNNYFKINPLLNSYESEYTLYENTKGCYDDRSMIEKNNGIAPSSIIGKRNNTIETHSMKSLCNGNVLNRGLNKDNNYNDRNVFRRNNIYANSNKILIDCMDYPSQRIASITRKYDNNNDNINKDSAYYLNESPNASYYYRNNQSSSRNKSQSTFLDQSNREKRGYIPPQLYHLDRHQSLQIIPPIQMNRKSNNRYLNHTEPSLFPIDYSNNNNNNILPLLQSKNYSTNTSTTELNVINPINNSRNIIRESYSESLLNKMKQKRKDEGVYLVKRFNH